MSRPENINSKTGNPNFYKLINSLDVGGVGHTRQKLEIWWNYRENIRSSSNKYNQKKTKNTYKGGSNRMSIRGGANRKIKIDINSLERAKLLSDTTHYGYNELYWIIILKLPVDRRENFQILY